MTIGPNDSSPSDVIARPIAKGTSTASAVEPATARNGTTFLTPARSTRGRSSSTASVATRPEKIVVRTVVVPRGSAEYSAASSWCVPGACSSSSRLTYAPAAASAVAHTAGIGLLAATGGGRRPPPADQDSAPRHVGMSAGRSGARGGSSGSKPAAPRADESGHHV